MTNTQADDCHENAHESVHAVDFVNNNTDDDSAATIATEHSNSVINNVDPDVEEQEDEEDDGTNSNTDQPQQEQQTTWRRLRRPDKWMKNKPKMNRNLGKHYVYKSRQGEEKQREQPNMWEQGVERHANINVNKIFPTLTER